jgi:D-glycero-alpha-D-manno-heptose-7-phosphate kinase
VVNFAVARHSYAQVQWLDRGAGCHFYSLDLKQGAWAADVGSVELDGRLDFVKAFARRLLNGRDDFLLVTQSDVPMRTGLGGSGAMGVAVTAACLKVAGHPVDQAEVAILANEVERSDLGLAGGNQDSFGAAIGGAKKIVLHKGGGTTCSQLNLPRNVVYRLERDMLLINTGRIHLSATIHEDIKRSYAAPSSPTIAAMDALKAEALTIADALEAGNLIGFASALNASRKHHYGLHESCDSDVLRSYFAKLDPLILGGKTCGAGGGGFIAVLARPGRKQDCIDAARSLGGEVWPFKMDHEGVVAWEEPDWTPTELEWFRSQARR